MPVAPAGHEVGVGEGQGAVPTWPQGVVLADGDGLGDGLGASTRYKVVFE